MDDYTGAEIYQMYAERLRERWQHTSTILATLCEVNRGKKGPKVTPNDFNPMERRQRKGKGIPLNTPEGFQQLRNLAKIRG